MKSIISMVVGGLLLTTVCQSQIHNAKIEIVKVYGNCSMCKSSIEKAANKKKISKANWNEETKMATITYNSKQTSIDAVLKNIALAGYDNSNFLAPDAAYNNLPDCCKYKRELKTTATLMTNQAEKSIKTDTTKQQINQLQIIFDNYFVLKDALVKTDAIAAAAKANLLLSTLNAIKMETLKTDEHTIWMQVEKDLKIDAQSIAASKNVEYQRGHFATLSNNLYILMKTVKPAQKIYYQHCPMYNNGKGADWLSKERSIKNPYYGSTMLTCGKTLETIQ